MLYAPTWEGDADYNDYTSVDVFGPQIAAGLLAAPQVRVVYKPHPKVVTSTTPAVAANHRAILAMLDAANTAAPEAGHAAIEFGDILAVMPSCDAMITDVSSVGLDWLYLCTEKPIIITDRRDDAETLRREVPVSRCADVVDSTTFDDPDTLTELVDARLDNDEHLMARVAMRHHYFGPLGVGESTTRFIDAIGEPVALRTELLGGPKVGQTVDLGAATA